MHPVAAYLREVSEIHRSGAGAPELSYYPALSALLNSVGHELRPKVRCIMNLRNRGAGLPDGGLFTPDQFGRGTDPEFGPDLTPARGVLEVKAADASVERVAAGEQVDRYFSQYRQVLVCNLWDFFLVGRDGAGTKAHLERFRLADSETEFWEKTAHPQATAKESGNSLMEYLKRVMLQAASLGDPREVAWLLASYAREAKFRVEAKGDLPKLASVRTGLEQALGVSFAGEKGEHFFRSTLVQTLFYGVFASWVMWAREVGHQDRYSRFNWKEASWTLHVPMMRALFTQVASPGQLEPLGLVEVLDWTAQALNRVDRAEFFTRFVEEHAVQYFYEPFLQAFDPQLRKDLGVWYTPPEIVAYMVERVDRVLRAELGIPDGLADSRVHVLDPCCGTGAYLVEVLRRIHRTRLEQGGDALAAQDVKRAAMQRVFGFELLPAPYVVAHMQLGLLLTTLGAPFRLEPAERAGVYLTNALTGWDPPEDPKQRLLFQELEEERDAAERVKREAPILVVLGNPPYNGFAGMAINEERNLISTYRETISAPKPQGQGLNDLYVRFFRMAERRIVEQTTHGIVCLISNYSWLDGLSFTGMREHLLTSFDRIWVDCLNGDKYKTGKLTPEGMPDPSVFSTQFNREGIQVGTAIALLVKNKQSNGKINSLCFNEFWGTTKREDLLHALERDDVSRYKEISPQAKAGFPFMPFSTPDTYFFWPLLIDIIPLSIPGVKTSRDSFLVDIDKERLIDRLELYFRNDISDEVIQSKYPCVMKDTSRFNARNVRSFLRRRGFIQKYVVRYCYRPFDTRWIYWEPETKLLDEKRNDFFNLLSPDNLWIEARQKQAQDNFDRGYVVKQLADNFGNGLSSFFPLNIYKNKGRNSLFDLEQDVILQNISQNAKLYLNHISFCGDSLFYHIISILHSPHYRNENASALRLDWPRIPLPNSKEALKVSSDLGRRVAALLDSETPVPGVIVGDLDPFLRLVGVVAAVEGESLDPDAGDLDVTEGWGHSGKEGITMPGRGRLLDRPYDAEEQTALAEAAARHGLDPETALALLGRSTCDVFLNPRACWRNVPETVWGYHIGGYQVLKKWLSYREKDILGRGLTVEEARHFTDTARRLAALRLLELELDNNYLAAKANAWPWPGQEATPR